MEDPSRDVVEVSGLRDAGPIVQAFVATSGTYLLTVVGTLPVLFFRSAPRAVLDAMMGFAAGVMVAASCWSLLVPAIELGGLVPAVTGLLAGAAVPWGADQLLPHLHAEFFEEARAEGPRVAWQRSTLLMVAMTLHNFPEGMAIGVTFGGSDAAAGLALAIGTVRSGSADIATLGFICGFTVMMALDNAFA
jgi:zinc transporter, ZIP family